MELGISRIPTRKEDLDILRSMGVKGIVCLAMEREIEPFWKDIYIYEREIVERDMEFFFLPTPPRKAPPLGLMIEALEWMDSRISSGKPITVHCFAGIGRAGTLAAAYLIFSRGMSARAAMEKVRKMRPGAIESYEQEEALRTLSAALMATLIGGIPFNLMLRPISTRRPGALRRSLITIKSLLRRIKS